jgi:hypothetical protein
MAQYSSWVHGVAAQQEADVKQNESVAASSILEFNSTEPTASNPGVLHCSKRFQGKSGGAQRFYFAIPTPNRQGPALGRWAARVRPHPPFARLHRRSRCVPAELYPPLQHRDVGLFCFECQLLAQTVFHTGTAMFDACIGMPQRKFVQPPRGTPFPKLNVLYFPIFRVPEYSCQPTWPPQ